MHRSTTAAAPRARPSPTSRTPPSAPDGRADARGLRPPANGPSSRVPSPSRTSVRSRRSADGGGRVWRHRACSIVAGFVRPPSARRPPRPAGPRTPHSVTVAGPGSTRTRRTTRTSTASGFAPPGDDRGRRVPRRDERDPARPWSEVNGRPAPRGQHVALSGPRRRRRGQRPDHRQRRTGRTSRSSTCRPASPTVTATSTGAGPTPGQVFLTLSFLGGGPKLRGRRGRARGADATCARRSTRWTSSDSPTATTRSPAAGAQPWTAGSTSSSSTRQFQQVAATPPWAWRTPSSTTRSCCRTAAGS